jgi:hypothetical protein
MTGVWEAYQDKEGETGVPEQDKSISLKWGVENLKKNLTAKHKKKICGSNDLITRYCIACESWFSMSLPGKCARQPEPGLGSKNTL